MISYRLIKVLKITRKVQSGSYKLTLLRSEFSISCCLVYTWQQAQYLGNLHIAMTLFTTRNSSKFYASFKKNKEKYHNYLLGIFSKFFSSECFVSTFFFSSPAKSPAPTAGLTNFMLSFSACNK